MCWGFQVQGLSFKVVRIRESPLVKVFGVEILTVPKSKHKP